MATTYFPAWKNAVARIVGGEFTYGSMITHAQMDDLLDLQRPEGRATAQAFKEFELRRFSALESLRKALLRDHLMDLQSVTGRGFQILLPQDQTKAAVEDGEAAIRKALRNKKMRLVHVDTAQLTSEQRKENTDAIVRTAAQAGALRQINRGILPPIPKRIRKEKTP